MQNIHGHTLRSLVVSSTLGAVHGSVDNEVVTTLQAHLNIAASRSLC